MLISLYKERLNLHNATFLYINHDDAMVAQVYKVIMPTSTQLILKICTHSTHYLREVYFLYYFADTLPVPRIIQVVEPGVDVSGAILMECLPGTLIKAVNFTDRVAYEIGSLLARIHVNRVAGYGELIQPDDLNFDPHRYFTMKFEEGIAECSNQLPEILIEQCRLYYYAHLYLLDSVDGPCIVHRDFRAGNVIINNGTVNGIIDWSSGRASFAQEDFCPLEHNEWPYNATGKQSFLAGYAAIRPVPEYNAMMQLLRLSKAIATIGFTIKRGLWKTTHAHVYQFNRTFLDTFMP